MNNNLISPLTLARKKREAAALKANMKRRKEASKQNSLLESAKEENVTPDSILPDSH